MQEYAKHIVQNGGLYLLLEEYPQQKKICLYPEIVNFMPALRQH